MIKKSMKPNFLMMNFFLILAIIFNPIIVIIPDYLMANIFWGGKGEKTYEKSNIKENVEKGDWLNWSNIVPKGVIASDGMYFNKITISWNLVGNDKIRAEKYYIYRAMSESGTYMGIGNAKWTSYDDTTVDTGIIYYYKIKAYTTSDGLSAFSDFDKGYCKESIPANKIPEMIYIPQVTNFRMGRIDASYNDGPAHSVNLDSFYMSKYEITVKQYTDFLNSGNKDLYYYFNMYDSMYCGIVKNNAGDYSIVPGRENYPVTYISWYNAEAYCNWLSDNTTNTYRLPTEAEWEYAAVGTNGHRDYPWGDDWVETNCNSSSLNDGFTNASPVGYYTNGQSPFGIYDMAGNVREWCFDRYDPYYYSISPKDNPTGPDNGSSRVIRGGSWKDYYNCLKTTYRYWSNPNNNYYFDGFRIVKKE